MTPEERQLIAGLFDRMRGFALAEKDGEAEALINQSMSSVRDASYMLVQSVLVQEHALGQADSRIRELEEQVRALQGAAQRRSAGAGSFLGGLFGSRPTEPAQGAGGPTSVPAIGSRATPSVYDSRQGWTPPQSPGQAGGPFAQAAGPGGQPGAQPGGGGFLRSAMATAAGVAGGMLVAGAIGNLLGGQSAQASTAGAQQSGSSSDAAGTSPASASAGDTAPLQGERQDAAATGSDSWQDQRHDAADDDGGDFDI